ncbi:RING finger protein 37 [Coemansia sp. RSA 2603]|nr:RING finger protein 37 [Coemansia sp. RSA 2603]
MAESFVKPPVEIVLQFPYELSLAAVVVDPRIRMHSAKMISVLIWNKRFNKWEYSGRLTWENEDNTTPQALCNRDLEPQVVSYSAQLHGSQLCRSLSASQWLPLEKHEEALHHVSQIKVRINSMHRAQTLGLGGLEIWAQPSQRMHPRQRNEAWQHIFRLRESTRRLQTTTSTSQIQSRVPDNIPCEFVDVITQTIMLDPVILPSGARCDRSTITKHLSVKNTDPFTGLSLDIDQVKPDLLLGQRIKAWLSGS